MIDDALLLSLARTDLPMLRAVRFDGAGLQLSLSHFAPQDREVLRRIYADLEGLSRLWRSMGLAPDWKALGRYATDLAVSGGLFDATRRLGLATHAAGSMGSEMRKALHDLRGGGLTALLGCAELLTLGRFSEGLARTCAAAARDHAKIMRCLLSDLDPAARTADEATKAHAIGHFVDKWQGTHVQGSEGPVAVTMRCAFVGAISARCLETASIDRVVYNLVNNAARFATTGEVELAVRSVGRGLTRWVVGNRIAAAEVAFLSGMDLKTLFAGGVTRGGSGIGLANCAEVVAQCFGLSEPLEAVRGEYLGAALRGDAFFTWFHWPAYTSYPDQAMENGEAPRSLGAASELM